MQSFDKFLVLFLSQRPRRSKRSRWHPQNDEAERLKDYDRMTPEILAELESAFEQWRRTMDFDIYHQRVRLAVAPLPRRKQALRRLTEPLQWMQIPQVREELRRLRKDLEDSSHGTKTGHE